MICYPVKKTFWFLISFDRAPTSRVEHKTHRGSTYIGFDAPRVTLIDPQLWLPIECALATATLSRLDSIIPPVSLYHVINDREVGPELLTRRHFSSYYTNEVRCLRENDLLLWPRSTSQPWMEPVSYSQQFYLGKCLFIAGKWFFEIFTSTSVRENFLFFHYSILRKERLLIKNF